MCLYEYPGRMTETSEECKLPFQRRWVYIWNVNKIRTYWIVDFVEDFFYYFTSLEFQLPFPHFVLLPAHLVLSSRTEWLFWENMSQESKWTLQQVWLYCSLLDKTWHFELKFVTGNYLKLAFQTAIFTTSSHSRVCVSTSDGVHVKQPQWRVSVMSFQINLG